MALLASNIDLENERCSTRARGTKRKNSSKFDFETTIKIAIKFSIDYGLLTII